MNKKYLLLALIFLTGFSYDSFAGHFDFDHHEEEHAIECQACEENVEITIGNRKNKLHFQIVTSKINQNSRFVSAKNKSNLSRAPPLN